MKLYNIFCDNDSAALHEVNSDDFTMYIYDNVVCYKRSSDGRYFHFGVDSFLKRDYNMVEVLKFYMEMLLSDYFIVYCGAYPKNK